jgi:hypothetical protein
VLPSLPDIGVKESIFKHGFGEHFDEYFLADIVGDVRQSADSFPSLFNISAMDFEEVERDF